MVARWEEVKSEVKSQAVDAESDQNIVGAGVRQTSTCRL